MVVALLVAPRAGRELDGALVDGARPRAVRSSIVGDTCLTKRDRRAPGRPQPQRHVGRALGHRPGGHRGEVGGHVLGSAMMSTEPMQTRWRSFAARRPTSRCRRPRQSHWKTPSQVATAASRSSRVSRLVLAVGEQDDVADGAGKLDEAVAGFAPASARSPCRRRPEHADTAVGGGAARARVGARQPVRGVQVAGLVGAGDDAEQHAVAQRLDGGDRRLRAATILRRGPIEPDRSITITTAAAGRCCRPAPGAPARCRRP